MLPFEKGFYINLGDWIEYFTYGCSETEKFELKSFDETKQFNRDQS